MYQKIQLSFAHEIMSVGYAGHLIVKGGKQDQISVLFYKKATNETSTSLKLILNTKINHLNSTWLHN